MIDELSKQQRRVLLLLLMAILLGVGSLLYQNFLRGPIEIHLVSPVSAPWPGAGLDSSFNNKTPLQLSNVLETKAESTENTNNQEEPVKKHGLIDPNIASSEELQTLPGIGPVLASRIIEYREEVKKYQKVEDLLEIKGIGEKTLEKIRQYIKINP